MVVQLQSGRDLPQFDNSGRKQDSPPQTRAQTVIEAVDHSACID